MEENNNNEKIVYKVVSVKKNKLYSFTYGLDYNWAIARKGFDLLVRNFLKKKGIIIEYIPGVSVYPNREFVGNYDLLAFGTKRNAEEFLDDYYNARGKFQIWKCKAIVNKRYYKKIHPRSFENLFAYTCNGVSNRKNFKTIIDSYMIGESPWPDGTIFCNEITLIERVK